MKGTPLNESGFRAIFALAAITGIASYFLKGNPDISDFLKGSVAGITIGLFAVALMFRQKMNPKR